MPVAECSHQRVKYLRSLDITPFFWNAEKTEKGAHTEAGSSHTHSPKGVTQATRKQTRAPWLQRVCLHLFIRSIHITHTQPTVDLTASKRITNLEELLSYKVRTIMGNKQH